MAAKGTRATDTLTRLGIAFSVHAYEHDPRADGYGVEAVERLGLDPDRTFKTLLAAHGSTLVVGVVPVSAMLDLKALARAAGVKSLALADPKVAERATGYVVGGISPVGQSQRLAVFVDDSAAELSTMFCSAGRRGLEIELAPADLLRACDGSFAAIARR
jgi:Cys-tRNA(Pro)/Cys-tRNA(Cys) deacylase